MTDHFDFGNVQPVKALDCELHGLGAHGRKVDFFAHHFAVVKHDAHVVPPAQLAQHLYQRHFVKIEKSLDPLGERVGVHVLTSTLPSASHTAASPGESVASPEPSGESISTLPLTSATWVLSGV